MNFKFSEKKRRRDIIKSRLMYSVIIGMMAAIVLATSGYPKAETQAWWGTLYPKYCYSQVPDHNDGEDREIRIRFRWLHGL